MWGRGDDVTCIACGESVPPEDAREYDKHGDRWERREKTFEHLCKPCHRELCHQPRGDLEALLVEAGAGQRSSSAFLEGYAALAEHRNRSERGSGDR